MFKGSLVCAASRYNSAVGKEEQGCFVSFQALERGPRLWTSGFTPRTAEPYWVSESLSDHHCRFCTSHLPQGEGHEPSTSQVPGEVASCKKLPQALQDSAPMTCCSSCSTFWSCLSSVSETPPPGSGLLGSICPSPWEWIMRGLSFQRCVQSCHGGSLKSARASIFTPEIGTCSESGLLCASWRARC